MPSPSYYIGLMSGTSADAIDAVLADFSLPSPLVATHSVPYPDELRREVHALSLPGNNEIDRTGYLDVELGELFAKVINQLVLNSGLDANQICAIGSHGQTIRHRPEGRNAHGFSLQIGDPNTIAERTGITTVADFRRRDMAAGGQGAPLVPAFHQAMFADATQSRILLNIGGIANISWLPQTMPVLGFDTGPGNTLMDQWINQHQGKKYDSAGEWAKTGKINPELLSALLNDSYFSRDFPKSTGLEAFNLTWLAEKITQLGIQPEPCDVQATLCALTVESIAIHCEQLTQEQGVGIYVCGGGAYNQHLMTSLKQRLTTFQLAATSELGIAPDWIEALAFAWLAKQTLEQKPGNLCAVTGARHPTILGGVYFA